MKVYGGNWAGPVSPQEIDRPHMAWDIRTSYDILWEMYSDSIQNETITPEWIQKELGYFDVAFSSIPAPSLCLHPHKHPFYAQKIYAWGETPERRIPFDDYRIATEEIKDNSIVCNGFVFPRWYRMSKVFGYSTVEWPSGYQRDDEYLPGGSMVEKPLSHNCNCMPSIHRIGRYGVWRKGILTHHTIDAVWNVLR